MLLFVLPVAAAAMINVLCRRPALSIALLSWRFAGVPLICLGTQMAAMWVAPGSLRSTIVVGSQVLITAWLGYHGYRFRHQARLALALLFFGAVMNLLPIIEYGSMPVSRSALSALGADAALDVREGKLGKHVEATGEGLTSFLGDTMAVPAFRAVISIGDIVMAFGLGLVSLAPLSMLSAGRRVRPAI